MTCRIKRHIFLSFYFCLLAICILFSDFWNHQFYSVEEQLYLQPDRSVKLLSGGQVYESHHPRDPGQSFYPLSQLPSPLLDFLIFQEDQSFFMHRGYSLRDIYIVLKDRIWVGHPIRGASTLTQQLARSLFLDRKKNLWRKLVELKIARLLEKELDKKTILELYLNHVYWGRGSYGIASASQVYFNRQPLALQVEQSMFLIAILPRPSACLQLKGCKDKGVLRRMERLRKHFSKNK